ncbi:S1 RNA binding domain protein [Paenisporosarcina quisquiliarum]|jgi:S1 RNA binding domain protein|uniref:S1 domain-containing RNA-binding protein n=1 Tax=Psychrobacillus psychrodurans TaxID=126157 RepID=A0A9X3RB68_9BACI|nr:MULTISPECIES: S1 domain-containing RNA-binding protein [Psychrobacillus]MCZ8535349.1 S1 domain-containing RNA-binding protein [Psychrobacillus psychrodurans]SDO27675.1 S1 RNA binding domain protein [Psychrobacillus sp. OK028]SEN95666.1 S1 RNA binding domain protein [Paenisporosarcina quisquiliarum]
MSIEVGSKVEGKVTGITNFGAFVELPGGSTGLVHISEVADNYVKDINEHLKVGDVVEVKVMNVEADGKIGLSIRKAKPQAERPERPERPQRPRNNNRPNDRDRPSKENFEQKMARFLKDSEDRLSTLKRATESKRGGRGAKRG